MTAQELQNRRAELAHKIKDVGTRWNATENKWANPSDESEWTAVNADYDAVCVELQDAVKQEAISRRLTEVEDASRSAVFTPPMPRGSSRLAANNADDSPLAGMDSQDVAAMAVQSWLKSKVGFELKPTEQIALKAMRGAIVSDRQEGPSFELYNLCSSRSQRLHRELQEAYRNCHPQHRHRLMNAINPLTTQTASTGGATVPAETFMPSFERAMLAFGGVRAVATFWQTTGGEPLAFATANDTGNSARIIAENVVADDNAGGGSTGDGGPNPVFAKTTWGAFKYVSDTVLVPYELLEDNAVNLMSHLQEMVTERLSRGTEAHFATGTDTTMPQGILVGSNTGVTAASATAITNAELITFQHSLNPAYRPGAAFMCHDNVVLYIRKLTDGQGNFIWASGFNGNVPDTLLGSPIYINNSFTSAMTANNYVMVYGQLNKYYIRRAGGLRLKVLTERYAEKDQVGVIAFLREDGGVLDAGTRPIKRLRMGA